MFLLIFKPVKNTDYRKTIVNPISEKRMNLDQRVCQNKISPNSNYSEKHYLKNIPWQNIQ